MLLERESEDERILANETRAKFPAWDSMPKEALSPATLARAHEFAFHRLGAPGFRFECESALA